jgi:hypothetical protein
MITLRCVLLSIALAACTAPASRREAALSPVTDTATVRRLCAAPDSVLAGKRACLLRDQRAIIKVF